MRGIKKIKKYYLIFIIFNLLFTTCENYRVQLDSEIQFRNTKKSTFKSNTSLKNYINISEI